MDLAKFVSLLANRALFFARSDKLDDPYEGSYSSVTIASRPHRWGINDVTQASENLRSIREHTFINCWHLSQHESVAMWALYSQKGQGISISSTFRALTAALQGTVPVYVGLVDYVDYSSAFIPDDNTFRAFLHKRVSFQYEQEIRAIIDQTPSLPDSLKLDVVHDGLLLPVDLDRLIAEVYVAPQMPSWYFDVVTSVTDRFSLHVDVRRSHLDADPMW